MLFRRTLIAFSGLLIFVSLGTTVVGQEGVSSMSVGAAHAGVASYTADGRFLMPSPDLLRVEEFVNYHRHDLPLPTGKRRVCLDIRKKQLSSGKTVLQFGISTPRELDPEEVPPLNLVLVIDQSGSMSGDRIARVKEAIHALVDRLRKTDKVCVVGFNDEARVILPATAKTKTKKVRKAVDSMVAHRSTNLHAGLMVGYQQARANYDSERTNRVILLSDGITNTGVVDLQQIARESKEFNKEGIDLSTIGLGHDLNHELLRELADAGRGLIHFVSDSKDIEKTFICEVESLLAPAARKVKLTIDFGSHIDRARAYGYSPKRKGSEMVFKLDDLNHGATQVVLAKIPAGHFNVTAELSYLDAIDGGAVRLVKSLDQTSEDNPSVDKNYALALVAQSIIRAAKKSREQDCRGAADRLTKGIKSAKKICSTEDKDVRRVVKIAKEYRNKILESIERRQSRD